MKCTEITGMITWAEKVLRDEKGKNMQEFLNTRIWTCTKSQLKSLTVTKCRTSILILIRLMIKYEKSCPEKLVMKEQSSKTLNLKTMNLKSQKSNQSKVSSLRIYQNLETHSCSQKVLTSKRRCRIINDLKHLSSTLPHANKNPRSKFLHLSKMNTWAPKT